MNDKIVRYSLAGGPVPADKPEVVLSGMPLGGDHPMHPFVINARGQLFIDMGSATNSCQPKTRFPGVPGAQPRDEPPTRAGAWLYSADKLGQTFSPAERYATGSRNGVGLSFDAQGRLFATRHGRDQLSQNWPKQHRGAMPAMGGARLSPDDVGTCWPAAKSWATGSPIPARFSRSRPRPRSGPVVRSDRQVSISGMDAVGNEIEDRLGCLAGSGASAHHG